MNNYFSIGKLVSVFGLQGEFVLKHSLGKKTSLPGVEVLFLEEKKNSFIPHFIQKTSIKDHEHVFVKLEGIDNKEDARRLVQMPVYLAEDDFKKQASSSAPLSLLGFTVQDKEQGIHVELYIKLDVRFAKRCHPGFINRILERRRVFNLNDLRQAHQQKRRNTCKQEHQEQKGITG